VFADRGAAGAARIDAMKKKLADLLWEAANEHLWDGAGQVPAAHERHRNQYSCDALHECFKWAGDRVAAKLHLAKMGCDTFKTSQFDLFAAGEMRQGVRYMWLLLAMHVAEDEGIMVEVAE
jgi:hypothetical protein